MWSSPRNLSTAMMYSWRQRLDTTVVDEPLYAHYLSTTGRRHPADTDVLEVQDHDGEAVIRDLMLGDYDTPIVFFKQMAKHIVDLDQSFLKKFSNILLTREPHDMLTSFQVHLPDTTIDDTGFPELLEILDAVLEAGEEPIVIETSRLLANPREVLSDLCGRVGVPFDDAMLSWPAGPKPEDGAWAPYWYDGVWKSTGWEPARPKDAVLLPEVAKALPEAEAAYQRLLPYQL
jgi:hypothetical protein